MNGVTHKSSVVHLSGRIIIWGNNKQFEKRHKLKNLFRSKKRLFAEPTAPSHLPHTG
jgi:hypothetical protein